MAEALWQRLDDTDALSKGDPAGMLAHIERLPEQCAQALALTDDLPGCKGPITSVTILGMGGSAIGGDLVRGLLAERAPIPITVNRGYDLPGYVGAQSLVIASSYSGNTEETLTAAKAAAARGAQLIAIATGGALARLAAEHGWPLVTIPAGLSPRAALGYSFVPLLVLLERLGLAGDGEPAREGVEEAVAVLTEQRKRLARDVPAAENAAKQLAAAWYGQLPVIYGSHGWKEAAAYRWKCQINENAKAPAYWNTFPELNHNETTAWEAPAELMQRMRIVLLRDRDDPAAIRRRADVTAAWMRPHVAGVDEVWAEGRHPVARLLSLIYPGDFASAYLALLYGVDPTPVPGIDHLKRALAAGG